MARLIPLVCVLVLTLAAPAAAAPTALGTGDSPSITVDPNGTSHVVWNESRPGAEADITHYCRLPRGATACANPDTTPMDMVGAQYSKDTGGPKILRVSADQLVVLTHRYPANVVHPDGVTRDRTTYTWTSFDNGDSWQGPGIGGTVEPSGDAAVVGGDDTRIAVITDRFTPGTDVQVLDPGAFTSAFARLSGNDAVADGTVAPDGTAIVTAFANNAGGVNVRRVPAGADVASAGAYSAAAIAGEELPRLAGGAGGTFLLTRRMSDQTMLVRGVSAGVPAAEQVISGPGAGQARALAEDVAGNLYAAISTSGSPQTVVVRKATAAAGFDPGTALPLGTTVSSLALGAAPDGGGVVTGVLDGGQVFVDAFGTGLPAPPSATPPAQPPLPPGAKEGCDLAKFGDVSFTAITTGGACFLKTKDPKFKGSLEAKGEGVDLNGLKLVPIGKAKILFDVRKRTLHTTGDVQVILRGPGIGDVPIYRGKLDLDLNDKRGESLFKDFDFPKGPDIKGFPIDADFDVKLAGDGVSIPISLKLPPVLLGLSAKATLRTTTAVGARLDSFEFTAGKIPLGPIAIDGLKIAYTGQSDTWTGDVGLKLPLGTISGGATFVDGDFAGAKLKIPFLRPGILVAPQVFFTGLGGAFNLKPAFLVSGTATFGAGYTPPPTDVFAAEIEGTITFTLVKGEAQFIYDGTGKFFGIGFGHERAIITTDGFVGVDGDFDLDFGVGSIKGGLTGFFDGGTKTFGASGQVQTTALGITLKRAGAALSGKGLGVCVDSTPVPVPGHELGGGPVQVGYHWTEPFPKAVDISTPDDCDLRDFKQDRPAGRARSAQAAGGTPFTGPGDGDVELTGAGGAPDVDLVAPDGTRITPQPEGTPGADRRVRVTKLGALGRTLLSFKGAPTGTWTAVPRAGSAAVAGVRVAVATKVPTVSGAVRGRGARKTLRYRVKGAAAGTTVQLQETWNGGSRPLATLPAGRRSGKLRLRFNRGPKGRRTVLAVATNGAATSAPQAVTTYTAPPRATLGAVRRLRVKGRRATWRRNGRPATLVVVARLKSGRTVARQLRGKARRVAFGSTLARVTVTPRELTGRTGKRASAKAPKKKKHHRHRRRKP